MAKWFIGQRVRVVRALHPENNGITGVITHFGPWGNHDILPNGNKLGGVADCFLSLDSPRHDGSLVGASPFDSLEPILYDGAQPIAESFEEMMGKLREGVFALIFM